MHTISALQAPRIFIVLSTFISLLFSAHAGQKMWIGGAGDTLWSSSANWSPAGAPGPSDNLTFTNEAATDTPLVLGGIINTEVDAGFSSTINSLGFRNIIGAHNLNLTKPLVIQGTSSTDVAFIQDDGEPVILFVGSGQADGAADSVYTSIVGDSLTVNNPNAGISVMQGSVTSGAHWATLDLSGLNSFNCSVLNILVAHDFGEPIMRPNGTLILAVSNSITAKMISIADAYQNAGSGGAGSRIFLGQGNILNVDKLRIGSHKCVGTLSFTELLQAPSHSARFRHSDGTGRQISWELGDQYEPRDIGYYTSGQSIGYLDLTGGIIDALVDTIVLGRGQTNAPTRNGDGNGTLTFGQGTIDANHLLMGIQLSGGGSAGRGTLNVNKDDGLTAAKMIVNGNLLMAQQLPGNTDTTGSTAEINLNGGILKVGGDMIDGGGRTTINISNGGQLDLDADELSPGNLSVDLLNLNDGTLVGYSSLSVSNLNLEGSVTQFTIAQGQTLLPIAAGTVGTLTVTGDLILRGTLEMDIRKAGAIRTSDILSVTGSLDLGGTLKVSLLGTTPLAAGDKFTLFNSASLANSFTTLALPSPGPGLAWQNNILADGSIEVISSGEPTTPPTLAFSSSTTGITLSWPAAYTSYVLRGQTNPVTVGINGNWGLVPGVVGNQVTIQPAPANGTVFFQLIQQ